MMDEDEIKAFIQQTYRNFQEGNLRGYLNAFAENMKWQLPESGQIPYAGMHTGREEFEQFVGKVHESQEIIEYEPLEYIIKKDRVIVIGKFLGRERGTGEEQDFNWVHIYTIRNGKITDFREFMDTSRKTDRPA